MTSILPAIDLAALVWFLAAAIGYPAVIRLTKLQPLSSAGAVQRQRLAWMRNMARRDSRIVDAQLVTALSQGNAFFASTSAIAIGGLVTLVGSGEKAAAFLRQISPSAPVSGLLWEVKILLLMTIFVFAFFEFAWAFRLSHFTAIMIGATPLPELSGEAERDAHAARTAALIGIAGEHANSGLRAFYFAIAALVWLLHPILFIGATAAVLFILIKRDFFSRATQIVLGTGPIGDDA